MRLLIAAIGRLKDKGERELLARYVKRIDQAGRAVAIGPLTISEMGEARAQEAAGRKSDEAARLGAAAAMSGRRIVLDEGGRPFTSAAFADLLRDWRDDGVRDVAFLIGGADGLDDKLLASADLKLSLSPMTLPHGLARVVLAEQIYRAITIIAGHPYHRS